MPNDVVITVRTDDKASGPLKHIGGQAQQTGGIFKTAAGTALGFAGALGGIAAVKGVFSSVLGGAMEAQKVMAQTEAVLKSTGGAAGVTATEVANLASSFQKVTPFEDEAIQSAENLLLTFTSIGKDIFPQATKTVLNMSTALGQDLSASSIQLGKALQDPITGVTALRRVGVNFNDAQQEMIKGLVESGDLMGAQTLILAELEKEFGGSAEAAGKTFGGQLTILRNRLSDVAENIGLKLLPHLSDLLAWLQVKGPPAIKMVEDAFDDLSEVIKTKVIPPVKEFWEKHGAKIIQFAKDAAKWFADYYVQLFNVYKAIAIFLAPALDTLSDLWSNLQPVLEKVLPPLEKVATFLTEHKKLLIAVGLAIMLLTNPWLAVVAVLAIVLAKWDEISQMFTVTIPAAIDAVLEKVTGFPVIGEIISGTFEAMWIIAQTVWALLQNHIETTINVIRDVIKIATALIKGDWGEAWEGVKQLFVDIWEGIKDALGIALTGIKDLVVNQLETLKGMVFDLAAAFWTFATQAGEAVVKGIWAGIQSMKDWLIDKVTGFGKSIFGAVKKGLGELWPGSPSKAGIKIAVGLADGMRAGASTAVAAAAALGTAVGSSLADAIIALTRGAADEARRILAEVAGLPSTESPTAQARRRLHRGTPAPYKLTDYAVKQARLLIAAGSPNAPSPASVLAGLAGGGPARAGRAYVVGERGPELFVPERSGQVIPNGASIGGGATIVFAPQISAIDGASIARIMPQLFAQFQRYAAGRLA